MIKLISFTVPAIDVLVTQNEVPKDKLYLYVYIIYIISNFLECGIMFLVRKKCVMIFGGYHFRMCFKYFFIEM